jgi:hypothetical protein
MTTKSRWRNIENGPTKGRSEDAPDIETEKTKPGKQMNGADKNRRPEIT